MRAIFAVVAIAGLCVAALLQDAELAASIVIGTAVFLMLTENPDHLEL